MRPPRMSTGAWIFTTAVTVAVSAPTAVYAAASSVVAIGDTTSTRTASVTTQHQLLTTPIAPRQVIHGSGGYAYNSCLSVYTPPAGKAVVVTSVTYDIGSGTAGTDAFGYLTDATCSSNYDVAETTQGFETQQHAFPTGLPMPSLGVYSFNGYIAVWFTGYLIPASQLPATAAPAHGPMPAHPMPAHP